jgi:hypothetical protein
MSVALSLVAVVLGTAAPLAAVLLVTRWRLRHATNQAKGPTLQPQPLNASRTPETRPPGLPWLQASIGPPPLSSAARDFRRPCPKCRYRPTQAAFFCLRCGTRLQDRRPY